MRSSISSGVQKHSYDVTRLEQLVRGDAVLGEPLALQHRSFVPREPEPSHRLLDADDPLVARPALIGVLDAQDERAAVVAREQVVEQRRARGPDVQRAGRRRRESDAHRL